MQKAVPSDISSSIAEKFTSRPYMEASPKSPIKRKKSKKLRKRRKMKKKRRSSKASINNNFKITDKDVEILSDNVSGEEFDDRIDWLKYRIIF